MPTDQTVSLLCSIQRSFEVCGALFKVTFYTSAHDEFETLFCGVENVIVGIIMSVCHATVNGQIKKEIKNNENICSFSSHIC